MPFSKNPNSLTAFKLIMITIVSVDSIRTIPISATYGFTLVSFYVIAAITFFIPLILVTSRFASEYPYIGGSYLWIGAALGKKVGFVSIWLQWVYQLIWYPTIFAFICVTLAHFVHPAWKDNHWFTWGLSLFLFWGLTFFSLFGIRVTSWISTASAILGTLLPMTVMIVLAAYWIFSGGQSQLQVSGSHLIPNVHALANLSFFSNILFSLLGLDVAAMHAGDVENPKTTYPKAMTIAGSLILVSLILSSLALCIVIPHQKIGLLSGVMDAFSAFFDTYHLHGLVVMMGAAIVLGSLGIAFSWMISLARGLHVACVSSRLFKPAEKLNAYHMPHFILWGQALIFTVLMTVFLLFPNLSSSYWVLSALTSQFALAYYILLFIAAIKLRHGPQKEGLSRLRLFGRVFFPALAILIVTVGIVVGFLPPSMISKNNIFKYELLLLSGILAFCAPLYLFFKRIK